MSLSYTNLVIGGAGSRNIATVGALEVLKPHLKNIKRLLGVSSGSILATLLAIDCSPEEIRKYYNSVDLSKFKINYWNPMVYYKLITKHGIHDSSKFKDIIYCILKDKTGDSDITFRQIYEIYGKELVIPVSCINKREQFFYNHISNPDMPVACAIEQSCCLPFVFAPVKDKEDSFIDGGLVDNFPLYYFNDELVLPNSKIEVVKPTGIIPNPKTIGILVIDPTVSKEPYVDPYLGNDNTNSFFGYMACILNTLLTTNSNIRMGPCHWDSVITINLNSTAVTNMVLPENIRENFIEIGKESANNFMLKYYI